MGSPPRRQRRARATKKPRASVKKCSPWPNGQGYFTISGNYYIAIDFFHKVCYNGISLGEVGE